MNDKAPNHQDAEVEWPLKETTPEEYFQLPESDRMGIEQIIRDMIAETNSKH